MAEKPLVIYRSSAGSGKTRTLVKEYLKLALRNRAGYFRHILAVTFANKATQEMKERIVRYLNDFISGRANPMAAELIHELGQSDAEFKENCHELRTQLLHQYGHFSISTIDAFFQKVIRSFTREAGLSGDYRLEVDNEAVLEEVVNNLIDHLGNDTDLKRWVVEFAIKKLESDQSWDMRKGLVEFSKELLKEDFRRIEEDFIAKTSDRKVLKDLLTELNKIRAAFINRVSNLAQTGFDAIKRNGLTKEDFWYGAAYGFFQKYIELNSVDGFKEPSKRVMEDLQDLNNWPKKQSLRYKEILAVTKATLYPLYKEILEYREQNYKRALSAEVVLQNFYAYGLMADISKKLQDYKAENNLMLLADAPHFLQKVIGDSDAPFIYEKIGSFYNNYLIDEFQDTSNLQWLNFVPLINESLSSNHRNVIVGDVKQAIYRWRGGDLTLLQQKLVQHLGGNRVEQVNLADNYRSAATIISFNNELFKTASVVLSKETGTNLAEATYADVSQQVVNDIRGFVDIQFIADEKNKEEKWKDYAKAQLVKTIEEWQQAGVKMKDIAILVRTNREGQELVTYVLNYKNSAEAKPSCNYHIISNESLRIDGAASVNLVLAAMRYLNNHADAVARAELAYEFARIHQSGMALADVFAVSNEAVFEGQLPQEFSRQKAALKKLPLFEMTEMLIRIFRLTEQTDELAYLQAFQNIVLNFYTRERNDLRAFLEWWEDHNDTEETSVKTSGSTDAAQIITIHKAKGLQFKYVIIPFCSWTLDHPGNKQPNLWVRSEAPLFKDAGYLSVRYSSKLKETFFEPYYQQEHTQIYLDNLNILYVALTRAELGLKIFAPDKRLVNDKGKLTISDVSALIRYCIESNSSLTAKWSQPELRWRNGVLEIPTSTTPYHQDESKPISLKGYPVARWRDKLVIRSAGKPYFNEATGEKVKYGIHVHALLSYIRTKNDIEPALQRAIYDGLLTSGEVDQVKADLEQLLRDPLIASWFDDSWDIRTEVPVMLPGGEESRFDRLLTKDSRAVVIDFKTGVPANEDIQQVQAYLEIIKAMNYTTVSGYVLYVRTGEVAEVTDGKRKAVKKKDDNQMKLDL
ncbi:MAG: UvrD-helicase domain-containing protein [Cyclobacteriaceae bacterium]|nr:UvrD-helicase domain-containing protein [Cyclobacteriaceae bacterium]